MKHLEIDGQVVLTKLESLAPPDRDPADGDVPAVIVDVETTGLNHQRDEVIQIARAALVILLLLFARCRIIFRVIDVLRSHRATI